jgi:Rrf2 family transcriptional regulator, cysteine metabolism repressor
VRISMRADYGARAMLDLAQRYGNGLAQTADIAARQQIPESYLEQLLTTVRKAGLIRSVRGPAGGHELARGPSEISLGDVLDALEGVSSPTSCMDEGACSVSEACILQDVWSDVVDTYRRMVHGITIAELLERSAERESRSMYHI